MRTQKRCSCDSLQDRAAGRHMCTVETSTLRKITPRADEHGRQSAQRVKLPGHKCYARILLRLSPSGVELQMALPCILVVDKRRAVTRAARPDVSPSRDSHVN